jgi:hypothetical protein
MAVCIVLVLMGGPVSCVITSMRLVIHLTGATTRANVCQEFKINTETTNSFAIAHKQWPAMALALSENTAKLPLKRFAMKQENTFASMGAIAILIIRTFAIYAIMPFMPLCHFMRDSLAYLCFFFQYL